ncbi:MAG: ModD protein [Defluviitaleaceae bacterium]|nr:ModD protein [Defluviitaleaceae bacterium]
MFITMEEIERIIKEDVPYIDLTSHSLGIGREMGQITYFTREDGVVCGAEEVAMVFQRLNIQINDFLASGSAIKGGDVLISGTGKAADLHMAWKVGQNILDNCSAIATKTRRMMDAVKAVNPNVAVLTTRKHFPGTKSLMVKGVMAGGANPHRLGISETVLIFKQHLEFIGGLDGLRAKMPNLKAECCEKKIIVEAVDFDEARRLCDIGADGVQFDKTPAADLKKWVTSLRADYPCVTLLAAGGINPQNAAEYAETGVDGLVTSSLYNAKALDIGVEIRRKTNG